MRLGVFGRGRLGSALAVGLGDSIAWQVAREEPPQVPVDAVIDVSASEAVERRVEWSTERRVPLVIGTTGWSLPDLEERVAGRTGVVVAPNFSLAVALTRRLAQVLGRFAELSESADPYVVEHHHARKADAPSGTARMLADTLVDSVDRKSGWRIDGPLAAEELSVAVLRAGHTYSEHRIGVDTPAEVLELRHTARGPEAFVEGARAAARWIQGRTGVFTMEDVTADVLDPLFQARDRHASATRQEQLS